MFPWCFYFNVFTSKYFLSGHNSKEANFILEAAARSLKNIEMFVEAATQSSTYSKTMCCTFFLLEAVVH